LLGRLILYGHDLADKLRQCADARAFARLALPFGTTDLTAILRSITRGLMLAIALHERLEQRAARGRDITPTPLRSPSLPAPAARLVPSRKRLRMSLRCLRRGRLSPNYILGVVR
jgi:hypothetical protein